ncbi:NACHT domain-containing protein, partial [Kosakonia quasisacchari]
MITATAVSTLTVSFLSGLMKKAGETFLENAVRKVGNQLSSSNIFKQLTNEKINQRYVENLVRSVFTFRTITSGDKDVFLDQIYYPLQVSSYKYKNIKIEDHETLENEMRVCLVGVAGQGKTMTLKKMFLEDMNKRQYFPFFISLRNIDFSREISLPEIIEKHFINNGIKCTKQEVSDFIKNASIRMYFDGFDEVTDSQRKNVLILLEECDLQWNTSVVCSTRPDTEFCKFPGYVTYNVAYLKKQDVLNIIDKNITNSDVRNQLKKILTDKEFLYDSIVTPILVDIFIVTSFGLG